MQKKKTIFIAGASGYGNIGDDAYKIIMSEYLNEKGYQVIFDSPYPDIQALKEHADYLIIGGGGLIYCNNTAHFDYMKMYMDAAIDKGIGYSFISCGVQLVNYNKETPSENHKEILPWSSYFDKADIITLRSTSCLKMVMECTENQSVFPCPDLCYGLKPANYLIRKPNTVVIIPTASSSRRVDFLQHWNEIKKDVPHENITILSFSRDDDEIVQQLKSELRTQEYISHRTRITPQEAVAVLSTASTVLTGRYHGLVLSRAAGLQNDQIYSYDSRYKSLVESPFHETNKENPERQLNLLYPHILP